MVKGCIVLTADNVAEDRSKSSFVLVSPCPLMSKATMRYLQEKCTQYFQEEHMQRHNGRNIVGAILLYPR
jgi:hypothetical protein